MKKLLIVIIILLILSSSVFAKLSDETLEEIEELRMKHYGIGSLICVDDGCIITWEPPPPIEIVDFEIEDKQLKVGWEVYINDKCYYILLVEKGE